MVCESWKTQLDTYLDGELPCEQTRAFDDHVHGCSSCAADALTRLQMKRSVQAAGKRFAPTPDFRLRLQRSIVRKPYRSFGVRWMFAAALPLLVLASFLASYFGVQRSRRDQVYGEIADLHVAALASSSRVDVVSSDRHTVKPWFQGKIPFTFDLPELQNSEFSLLGGRMTYFDQTPGAHLIYEVRKHEISVFIFQEAALRAKWEKESPLTKELSFNMETWSQGGLRYCVVGDAASTDISNLAELLKRAASS
ncbi:MAG TPA: zf-HC2 domain-containing protein [Candidatus Sulfotelmatobacter sp.]|jgi:anti-sigma factor RsiW